MTTRQPTILAFAVATLFAGVAAHASPPGSGWRMLFADEFTNSQVNDSKWITRYPWGRTHNHNAYMRDENVVLGDGTATLVATREPTSGKAFSSGIISTGYTKFTFTGGYAEARILLPDTKGSWPAFWGLYTGWPPESDIMEYPIDTAQGSGYAQSEYHTAWHYSTGGGGNSAGAGKVNPSGVGDLGGTYHTFGMEWIEDDWVGYYFDGQLVSSFGTNSAIAQMQYMYLILNYAVGGWPGTPNQSEWADGHSDETKIDWVRVWQKESTPDTTWNYNAGSSGSWGDDANWSSASPEWGRQKAYLPTLAGRSTMQVTWNNSKTVGELHFTGDTAYTIGDSASDNLMFANNNDGWGRIRVLSGSGGHAINSKIDLWSNLSLKNDIGSFTINGDILGQARDIGGGTWSGGVLKLWGAGSITINGDGHYQRATLIQSGVTVALNGKLYQDSAGLLDATETYLEVSGGSTLSLVDLDEGGSLGHLPADSDRIVLDDGKLVLRGVTNTSRGFTIGAGGAIIDATLFSNVTLTDNGVPAREIIANGGDLTLQGFEPATFGKALGGTGGLIKAGSNTWTLSADNTYAGATTVTGGRLNLTGTTGASDTTVHSGATLFGGGTVPANLIALSGATVEPGGDRTVGGGPFSPGAQFDLQVDGDYTQQSGATFKVELLSATVHDRMAVSGAAAIAGALAIEQDYAVTLGDSFVVLAAGTLTGAFDQTQITGTTIDADSAIAVLYEGNHVRLYATYLGDANGDGEVSLLDLNTIGANFGQAGAWQAGDFNYDGEVTLLDLNTLGANFGSSVAAAQPAVPEPTSLALLALGGAAVLRRQGRKAV